MSPAKGATDQQAAANLKEALDLHCEPPQGLHPPKLDGLRIRPGFPTAVDKRHVTHYNQS